MHRKTHDVVVAGHICLDITPDFGERSVHLDSLFVPGRLSEVGNAAMSTGGAVSNTGLALVRLGIKTRLMGKIGRDEFGAAVLSLLSKRGVRTGMIEDARAATSYTLIISPPGVDRIFLHCPAANDSFSSADIDYRAVKDCRLFHFGYPTVMRGICRNRGAELLKILSKAKRLGATTSLDCTLPDAASFGGKQNWRGILGRALPHLDIFTPSAEELTYMLEPRAFARLKHRAAGKELLDLYHPSLIRRLGEKLIKGGAAIAMIKCGHRGIYLKTGSEKRLRQAGAAITRPAAWSERELWQEACRVKKVSSTTGAGDSAIAGLLAAMLRGETPEKALRVAVCLGAQNVRVLDATSGIKSWSATLKMLPRLKYLDAAVADGREWVRCGSGILRGCCDKCD